MKGIKNILLGLLLLTSVSFSQGFGLGNRVLMGSTTTTIPPEITLTSTSILSSWSPNFIVNTSPTLDWTVSGGVTIATTTIDDPTFDFSGNTGDANVLIENTDNTTEFNVSNLSITTIDVSPSVALTNLTLTNNLLTSLDLSTNINLVGLLINTNSIASINLSNNTALTNFDCQDNSITTLDLSSNINMLTVNCRNNGMTTINVSGLTSMTMLLASTNSLTGFDIISNTSLSSIECQGNSFPDTVTNQILADLVAAGVTNGTLHYRNNETGQGVTDRQTLIDRGWTIFNYST